MSSPRRIVSLVPSQTELLAYLGLDEFIKGITRYCVHPTQWQQAKTLVGGTKNVDHAAIEQLNPDLIIANKEENTLESIVALREAFPVWTSDVNNLQQALSMISEVGRITGTSEKAQSLVSAIGKRFNQITPCRMQRVLYMIWRKPWMAAASGTFINAMLESLSLTNAVGDKTRYPTLTESEITAIDPAYVLLSSEPFPFRESHIAEIRRLLPAATVLLVNGEMFSWYGSRLLDAPAYFNSLPIARR
jgi:ABC-type Fe3+-hydroxamate transport system substrate-binding protein